MPNWLKRILGFGLTTLGGWVGAKYGAEYGAAVGGVGGVVLHEADRLLAPRVPRP